MSTISLELFELPYLRHMYYSNNSLFYIDHELKVIVLGVLCIFFYCWPIFKTEFAALEAASGGTIEENQFCQLSADIGAELGTPARFSTSKYLIQSNATNYTATIFTILQFTNGRTWKYNRNGSVHVPIVAGVFWSKTN